MADLSVTPADPERVLDDPTLSQRQKEVALVEWLHWKLAQTNNESAQVMAEAKVHHCPECDADLRGGPIPQEQIDSGFHEALCSECGERNHWGREIGIYSTAVDMTVQWECPDCGHRWNRTQPTQPGGFRKTDVKLIH